MAHGHGAGIRDPGHGSAGRGAEPASPATFRGVAAVRFLPSLAACESEHDVEATLLGLLYCDGREEGSDRDRLQTIRRFTERWTTIPLVAYAPFTPTAMHQCWSARKAGVGTLVIRGHDNLLTVLAPLLERRSAQPIMRDIHAEFFDTQPQPSEAAWHVMQYCLTHVRDGLTVARLADVSRVCPRTMATTLSRAAWPSPERLISCTPACSFSPGSCATESVCQPRRLDTRGGRGVVTSPRRALPRTPGGVAARARRHGARRGRDAAWASVPARPPHCWVSPRPARWVTAPGTTALHPADRGSHPHTVLT